MSKKLYEEANISAIASAIRSKNGASSLYSVADMASAILSISAVVQSITISSNGSYVPASGIDGFSNVVVSVPGSGILVSKTISENGSYNALLNDNADGYSEVVVSVPASVEDDRWDILFGLKSGSLYDESATIVRSYMFATNTKITGVEMTNVKTIHISAFRSCSNLTVASFRKCETVEAYAFQHDPLQSVYLHECITLANSAFNGAMLSFIYAPKCKTIGSSCFISTRFQSADFPECVTVGAYAFSGTPILEAYFPVCTTTGPQAFLGCYSLNNIYFGALESIGYQTFMYCTGLTEISDLNFPVLKRMDRSAFHRCSNLTKVSFTNLSTLADNDFNQCIKLESVYLLSSSIVTLGAAFNRVFGVTPIMDSSYLGYFGSVYVPASLVDEYKSANYWSLYSNRITAYIEPEPGP